jgi:hypothetical protein
MRPTITFTVGAHEFKIKSYLTGREKRDVTSVYIEKGVNIQSGGMNSVAVETINKAQDLALNTLIVEIDGAAVANPAEFVLNLPSNESDIVIAEINKIVTPPNAEEKKTV